MAHRADAGAASGGNHVFRVHVGSAVLDYPAGRRTRCHGRCHAGPAARESWLDRSAVVHGESRREPGVVTGRMVVQGKPNSPNRLCEGQAD